MLNMFLQTMSWLGSELCLRTGQKEADRITKEKKALPFDIKCLQFKRDLGLVGSKSNQAKTKWAKWEGFPSCMLCAVDTFMASNMFEHLWSEPDCSSKFHSQSMVVCRRFLHGKSSLAYTFLFSQNHFALVCPCNILAFFWAGSSFCCPFGTKKERLKSRKSAEKSSRVAKGTGG